MESSVYARAVLLLATLRLPTLLPELQYVSNETLVT